MDVAVVGRALSTLPREDDHPYRTGPWRPQTSEYRVDDLAVTGTIPSDLEGVYLRNTETALHPAVERYHPFDGDGMVHAVGFRDGKAFYRNRFVRTDGYLAEQVAGRSLWAGLAENPARAERADGWGARGRMKDASSTDVLVHAGVALTSFYQCGDLYRLDPMTLETLGKADWNGRFPSAEGVSAHAKVDPRTGEMLFFGYSTQAPYLHYGVVSPGDELVHYTGIELPGPRLPHDMAFTDRYAVLNDCPLFWDPAVLAKGHYLPRYYRDLPLRIGVVPRRGDSRDIRWFEAESTYVLHWVNAYEEGEEVVLEGFFQEEPAPHDRPEDGEYERIFRYLALDRVKAKLHRWRLNMVTGAVTEERLSDRITEFGMINPGHAGRRHRYVYAATGAPSWFLFDGLVRHDVDTGAEESITFGPGVYASETVMAPRLGSTGEDDGYLVTITVDMVNDRSECLVLDPRDLAAGPVARVALPERVSSGTHATWASGAELPGWRTDQMPGSTVGL